MNEILSNEDALVRSTAPMLDFQPMDASFVGYNPNTNQAVTDTAGRFMSFIGGIADTAGTSLRAAYAFGDRLSQEKQENYNPFTDSQVTSLGTEFMNTYKDYLMDSPNEIYTARAIQYLREKQENALLYQEHGISHFIGQLTGSLVDPLTFLPLVGIERAAMAASKVVGTAVFGIEGGLLGAAYTAAQSEYDPTVDDETIMSSAVLGIAFGTALGGLFAAGATSKALPEFVTQEFGAVGTNKNFIEDFKLDALDNDLFSPFRDDMFSGIVEPTPQTVVKITNTPNKKIKKANTNKKVTEVVPSTTSVPNSLVDVTNSAPPQQVNKDELFKQLVEADKEWNRLEWLYQKAKNDTGMTKGDLNPHGKPAGIAFRKAKALRKQYDELVEKELAGEKTDG